MNANTPIVSVTDFVRNFSDYVDLLPKVEEIILTRDSRAIATIKSTAEEKNRELLAFLGTWDPKLFANNEAWKAVAVRRNRKSPVKL